MDTAEQQMPGIVLQCQVLSHPAHRWADDNHHDCQPQQEDYRRNYESRDKKTKRTYRFPAAGATNEEHPAEDQKGDDNSQSHPCCHLMALEFSPKRCGRPFKARPRLSTDALVVIWPRWSDRRLARLERALESRGLSLGHTLETGSREGVWKAVEQGLAISAVADFVFIAQPRLKTLRIYDCDIRTEYNIAFLADRAATIAHPADGGSGSARDRRRG